MADSNDGLHEDPAELSSMTKDMHRALVSLQEELEAVDWYRQRAEACRDGELRAVLLHNMREEIEHSAMVLEWLRRRDGDFDAQLRTYLFTEVAITEAEDAATASETPPDTEDDARSPSQRPEPLTLGSLKATDQEEHS